MGVCHAARKLSYTQHYPQKCGQPGRFSGNLPLKLWITIRFAKYYTQFYSQTMQIFG